MSTDTTDDVNHSNDGEPANLPPHGIRGFLTAYYVYILIAAGLCLLEFFGVSAKTAPIWSATALLKFAFFVFAAKSLKRIGTAWVRNLHIALNGVLSVAVITAVALSYTTVMPTTTPRTSPRTPPPAAPRIAPMIPPTIANSIGIMFHPNIKRREYRKEHSKYDKDVCDRFMSGPIGAFYVDRHD